MTESTSACHKRHFTFQVRFPHVVRQSRMHSLGFRHALINLSSHRATDVEADAQVHCFLLWDQFVSPDLGLHFSGANVTVRACISTSHCLQQISGFPTLALRWLASTTSITAWIHPVKCSHDTKIRNDRRSSTKAISFTSTTASSPERVARLLALMELSSAASLRPWIP